jgi:hypothetical protein
MGTTRILLPFRRVNLSLGTEVELRTRLQSVLSAMYPNGATRERRSEARYPYPNLVHLTPVGDDGYTPCGETMVVVGKDLSENGISFYHPEVIPHRRMIASLDMGRGRWLGVLVDLRWCRFTKAGWYESGGRFLQLVQSPVKRAG